MGRLIPAPWPVLHTPRGIETVIDAHGNDRIVDGEPVIRHVIAIFGVSTGGALSSDEMVGNEFLSQTKTLFHMVIPTQDLGFYHSGDQVMVGGEVVDGTYVGGAAFRLDGDPASDLHGPWKRYYRVFGGYVKILRVN